jgi:hypothetical protein
MKSSLPWTAQILGKPIDLVFCGCFAAHGDGVCLVIMQPEEMAAKDLKLE